MLVWATQALKEDRGRSWRGVPRCVAAAGNWLRPDISQLICWEGARGGSNHFLRIWEDLVHCAVGGIIRYLTRKV